MDSDAWSAEIALQILVKASADVEGARAIRAAAPPPPAIVIGGAVLGRLRPNKDY
jgi:hypothetical protein